MPGKETVSWPDILLWASQAIWLIVSLVLLVQLKVLGRQSLADAPARRSNLSLLAVAGVILFYLGTVVATQLAVGVFYRPSIAAVSQREPAIASTTTAPATGPAALATTARSTQGAPAAKLPLENAHVAMILQIADAFTKILPVLLILFLCRRLVVGGIDGWGLSLRKIPRGMAYGLLGLLVIYPLLVVLNIIVSVFIAYFEKRPEETHETLQLLGRHDISSWERVTFILMAGVFAPVLEEIFFRGLLQTVFMEKGWGLVPQENPALKRANPQPDLPAPGQLTAASAAETDTVLSHQSPTPAARYDRRMFKHRWLAILASSFIFAFIHLMPDSFLVLFLLAIALGYLYERTNNLWACITLHAAFNCLNIYLYTRG